MIVERRRRTPLPRAGAGLPLRRSLRPRGPVHVDFSERRRGGAVHIRVDGELDILTAPKLASLLNSILREHPADVVLDLRRVDFLDSAGLGVLLNAHRRLARASKGMSVICDDGPVKRVFELARLTETLGVVSAPGAHEELLWTGESRSIS